MAEAKKKPVDFLDQYEGAGLVGMTLDDFQIPRLKVTQSLSPECDPDEPAYIKGAKPGVFVLTAANLILGDTVEVVPVYRKNSWIEWKPNRGGLVARHAPGSIDVDKSDFSEWFRPETGNTIQDTREFLVIVVGHEEIGPVILSLTSTMIKSAKAWNTLINLQQTMSGKKAPIFAYSWTLSLVKQKNDLGTWFMITTQPERSPKTISQSYFQDYIEAPFSAGESILGNAMTSAEHEERPQIEHKPKGTKSGRMTAAAMGEDDDGETPKY